MTHEEKDYEEFVAMIRGKYKLQTLHQIMKDITTMTSGAPTHKSAFRAALQANLLKEHCDKPQHKILKDFLAVLDMMKIETDDDENEKMDADFEEGECLTTDYESDGSV